ncbi:MAG: ATP F0F1 synthase subunit B, partial [Pseudomonadota bacterium]|nr:ATP F0F1 synthase subunit B [Pseudomonadota bacterium]
SARDEAERLARDAQEKLADFITRRTASAEAKIAQAEAQASAEVRAAAVDAAIKASERVLRDEITGPTAASLVTASLNDVRTKLQ